jgi:hypothetical protein
MLMLEREKNGGQSCLNSDNGKVRLSCTRISADFVGGQADGQRSSFASHRDDEALRSNRNGGGNRF